MIRSTRWRPLLGGLVLLLALCGLQRPASALLSLQDVSRAHAKELGITVQAQSRPDSGDVWVKVDFQTTGALKNFSWAELEVNRDGKRLVTATLMPRKPAIDSAPREKRLEFYIDPAALPDATVTVFASQPLFSTGYRLKMKDFLPPAAPAR